MNPDYGPFYENSRDLQPEKIKSVEGILEQGLGSRLSASASVFYNRITNLITLETDSSSGLSVYENSQGATAKGVEVELSGGLAAGLTGRASYSYTQTASLETGQPPPNSPSNLVKLNLSLPLLHERLSAATGRTVHRQGHHAGRKYFGRVLRPECHLDHPHLRQTRGYFRKRLQPAGQKIFFPRPS